MRSIKFDTKISLLERTNTPIYWPKKLNRYYKTENLYIKLEGLSPTGNHKFWFAQIACKEFLKMKKYNGIAVASCGYYAYSIAWLCSKLDIKAVLFIIRNNPLRIPRSKGIMTVDLAGNYDEAVNNCANFCEVNNFLNATPGFELKSQFIYGLNQIAHETINFFGNTPITILCPIGNGTTIAAIHNGFKSVPNLKTKQKLYGIGINKNTLFHSNKTVDINIDWELEPICSDNPLDRISAIKAIEESHGELICVRKSSIHKSLFLLSKLEYIRCHFSSAIPIAGFEKLLNTRKNSVDEKILLILTTVINRGPYENRFSF